MKNMTKNNEQNLIDVNEVVNSIRKYCQQDTNRAIFSMLIEH